MDSTTTSNTTTTFSQGGRLDMALEDIDLGELDLTSDTLHSLKTQLAFDQSHLVKTALKEGRDLRKYAADIEEELFDLERSSIDDYVGVEQFVDELHQQIGVCDAVLLDMEAVLGKFQDDLGSISAEIQQLQDKSLAINVSLRNRQFIGQQMTQVIEQLAIAPDLISQIYDADVNEQFISLLLEIDRKHTFLQTDMLRGSRAAADIEPELTKVARRASHRAKEFLAQKITAMKKPKMNVSVHQMSSLLKFKYFSEFLHKFSPAEDYPEITKLYVDTMSRVYVTNFKTYWSALLKLKTKTQAMTLLGTTELQDRLAKIDDEKAPAIIGEEAAETKGAKYTFDLLYKSAHSVLADTATSEYLFEWEFFSSHDVSADHVFSQVYSLFEQQTETFLSSSASNDIITICLLIRVVHLLQRQMMMRRVPALDHYCDRQLLMLWPKFKVLCGQYAEKLRSTSDTSLNMARQYASMIVAIQRSVLVFPNEDTPPAWTDTVQMTLTELRNSFAEALETVGKMLHSEEKKVIFLINSYACCQETDGEFQRPIDEFHGALLQNSIQRYVDLEMRAHFPKMMLLFDMERGKEQAAAVEGFVKEFNSIWKEKIEKIHDDVLKSFSDFKNGVSVLKACLTQLLLYYNRVATMVSDRGDLKGLKKDLVPQQVMLYEMKRFAQIEL